MTSTTTHDDGVPSWGERWLAEMATRSRSYAEGLDRGSYYASRGAVRSLEITPGHVTAQVQHARQRRQTVHLDCPTIDDDEWQALVERLAGELRFSARLLDGELPPAIADVLADGPEGLLPTREQVDETCICTDGGEPCIHRAAVHHALARQLDDDPFRLLDLRGRDRRALLAGIRAIRSGIDLRTAARSPDAVPIEEIEADDVASARGDLEAVGLHPHRVEDPAWLFDHLGDPPGVEDTAGLQQLIWAAAETAWRLAAGEGAGAADDELLLTELRSRRMSTAEALAEALGWDVEVAREALDRMFDDGAVMRMGSGEGAKYRAAS